jgi:hypothetical protein
VDGGLLKSMFSRKKTVDCLHCFTGHIKEVVNTHEVLKFNRSNTRERNYKRERGRENDLVSLTVWISVCRGECFLLNLKSPPQR